MLSIRSNDKLKKCSMKIKFVVVICILFYGYAKAQNLSPEVFTSSGDYYTSADASLSWTIGEDLTETYVKSFAILTQGFQQPESQFIGITEKENDYEINIYPNPTKDKIFINVKNSSILRFNIKLIDLYGRLYYNKDFETDELTEQIELKNYKTGTFFIRLFDSSGKALKSTTIIKVN